MKDRGAMFLIHSSVWESEPYNDLHRICVERGEDFHMCFAHAFALLGFMRPHDVLTESQAQCIHDSGLFERQPSGSWAYNTALFCHPDDPRYEGLLATDYFAEGWRGIPCMPVDRS